MLNTTMFDLGGDPPREPKVTYTRVILDDDAPPYNPANIVVDVVARASILVPAGPSAWIAIEVDSPGCWGVEVAGRNDPYLDELYTEELATLKAMLADMKKLTV